MTSEHEHLKLCPTTSLCSIMCVQVPSRHCVTKCPTISGLEATTFILLMSAIRQSLLGTAYPCSASQLEKQLEGWAKSPKVSPSHLVTDAGCQQGSWLGLLSKAPCDLSVLAEA